MSTNFQKYSKLICMLLIIIIVVKIPEDNRKGKGLAEKQQLLSITSSLCCLPAIRGPHFGNHWYTERHRYAKGLFLPTR